jgi:hypothetical protein
MKRHSQPPAPHGRYRLTPPLARVFVGAIGTTAIMSAGFFVFVPFSDLSTLQLAAGPHASSAAGFQPADIVMANTGRAWGDAALQRQAAAASVPLASMAQRKASPTR